MQQFPPERETIHGRRTDLSRRLNAREITFGIPHWLVRRLNGRINFSLDEIPFIFPVSRHDATRRTFAVKWGPGARSPGEFYGVFSFGNSFPFRPSVYVGRSPDSGYIVASTGVLVDAVSANLLPPSRKEDLRKILSRDLHPFQLHGHLSFVASGSVYPVMSIKFSPRCIEFTERPREIETKTEIER